MQKHLSPMFFIKIYLIGSHACLASVMVSVEGKMASFGGMRALMWRLCSDNGAERNRLLVSETQINLQIQISLLLLLSTMAPTPTKQKKKNPKPC